MPRKKKSAAAAAGEPLRRGPRPGYRRVPGTRSTPKQPFSLILNPDELNLLKKMALKEGSSVAAVIRSALHKVIFSTHPEMARSAIENDVESFLNHMGTKLALKRGTVGREKIKRQLVKGLMSGTRKR